MVDLEKICPEGATVAGPYSPGVKAGNLLFVSGQVPTRGTTEIKEQTQTVLENIKKIVEAAGAKVSNIVKITVFLKNINDFAEMNKVYKTFFEENGVTEKFPSRSTVEVSNFPLSGMLIEIDAIAVL
ncbi:MAG: RidA family protein [Candidatus Lokiarchaeota archaeon]|nr:RidA family protein [Candidatus Lokiarchaeota archaeon]